MREVRGTRWVQVAQKREPYRISRPWIIPGRVRAPARPGPNACHPESEAPIRSIAYQG